MKFLLVLKTMVFIHFCSQTETFVWITIHVDDMHDKILPHFTCSGYTVPRKYLLYYTVFSKTMYMQQRVQDERE